MSRDLQRLLPTREIRERVRRGREAHVRQPMIDLLDDLADVDPWWPSQHTVAVLASDLEDGQHAPTALDIGVREL